MIITDSISSLQALKSQMLNNPIVSNILHMYATITYIDTRALFFAGYRALLTFTARGSTLVVRI